MCALLVAFDTRLFGVMSSYISSCFLTEIYQEPSDETK